MTVTVDDVNHNNKPGRATRDTASGSPPKRTRVLRAADVIPPFDKGPLAADGGTRGTEQPSISRTSAGRTPPSPAGGKGGRRKSGDVSNAGAGRNGPSSADAAEIPVYDLAENILAAQRRVAGRRRRRPGRAEEPVASSGETGGKVALPDPAARDLLDLQRIVSEIVARDIEGLCRRPDRPAYARW